MNLLSQESSPYLLQHKDNPVHWMPWGEEAFEKAEKENKIVLVSVGYSACHWCHVMEHESFEDVEVAQIMNEHFICVKVDREERPDVDKAYMEAVQMMNRQGGWPLNCFTLPNKKPFFGGTYFSKEKWKSVLKQLVKLWGEEREQVLDFSEKVAQGVEQGLQYYQKESEILNTEDLDLALDSWRSNWDAEMGGYNGAPKFPVPDSYSFLLDYALKANDVKMLDHVHLTLVEMGRGGIYDQIGGGFCRYSVDQYWKVPHFEKMLYDNAQLLELYSKGYKVFKDDEFEEVANGIYEFCIRELKSKDGLFYSALDADSEGVEGKFYVWSIEDLKDLFSEDDIEKIKYFYNFNAFGEWEGSYIPLRQMSHEKTAEDWGWSVNKFLDWKQKVDQTLLKSREERVRPGLDNKIICSWNALLVQGFISLGKTNEAKQLLDNLLSKFYNSDEGTLCRILTHKIEVKGFLDDYAHLINACLKFYLATFDERYVEISNDLTQLVLSKFFDQNLGFFNYSEIAESELFSQQADFVDDVIPSSNAIMCEVLQILSVIYQSSHYGKVYHGLLKRASDKVRKMSSNYSHWAKNLLRVHSLREIAIVGESSHDFYSELKSSFSSTDLVLVSTNRSGLPVFKDRFQEMETSIFVCEDQTCQAPVKDVTSALSLLIS